MTITVRHEHAAFQVEANGGHIGSYPDVFLKGIKGINPDNKKTTGALLQRLFEGAHNALCPKTVVSNTLVAARGLGHDIRRRQPV